jgi:2-aminoadipate transaminase
LTTDSFDYTELLRPDLPLPAARWTGFPKYNFVGGHGAADSVPIDGLIEAAMRVLRREGRTLATYGLESGAQGYRPLREFIARKLAEDAGIACSADEVMITSGSLQGLDLVNHVLCSRGDTVIVEQMTYGGMITRLKRLGTNIVGIPVDRDGLRTDALESALQDLAARGVRPKYIYTIPTVQNPSATILTEARRAALLELSERYGVPIFEDECYADLTWDGRRPQALRGMSRDDRVIHIGSFSKTIAPALRIGYLVAGWPLMSRIVSIKSDGGSGALEQMILAEYCQEHFRSHVKALRDTLHRKADALMDALRARFGAEAQFDVPAGGIFLWVQLPDSVDSTRLSQLALQAGIAINPGAEWTTDATTGKSCMRVCFAHPPEQGIREGVAQLAQVCRREFGVPSPSAGVHR